MVIMILQAVILGIIQGVTEFLPISSTGHLIIANDYIGFHGEFANLFAVVIQSGSILAVILYFRDKLFPKFEKKEDFKKYGSLLSKVAIAIIPAGIMGILFDDMIEFYLYNPSAVAVALMVGAAIILLVDNDKRKMNVNTEEKITYKQALLVGIAQCAALIPGMSRSASTIVGGLLVGFNRSIAAEFSFFMSIPTILGASLLKLLKNGMVLTQMEIGLLVIGTVVSFVVSYMVIAFLMNYIKKHDFKIFAYYRIALGILVLLFA